MRALFAAGLALVAFATGVFADNPCSQYSTCQFEQCASIYAASLGDGTHCAEMAVANSDGTGTQQSTCGSDVKGVCYCAQRKGSLCINFWECLNTPAYCAPTMLNGNPVYAYEVDFVSTEMDCEPDCTPTGIGISSAGCIVIGTVDYAVRQQVEQCFIPT